MASGVRGQEASDVVAADGQEGEQQQPPGEITHEIGKAAEIEQARHELQGDGAEDDADDAPIAALRLHPGHHGNEDGDEQVRAAVVELHIDVACRDDDADKARQQAGYRVGGDDHAVPRKACIDGGLGIGAHQHQPQAIGRELQQCGDSGCDQNEDEEADRNPGDHVVADTRQQRGAADRHGLAAGDDHGEPHEGHLRPECAEDGRDVQPRDEDTVDDAAGKADEEGAQDEGETEGRAAFRRRDKRRDDDSRQDAGKVSERNARKIDTAIAGAHGEHHADGQETDFRNLACHGLKIEEGKERAAGNQGARHQQKAVYDSKHRQLSAGFLHDFLPFVY